MRGSSACVGDSEELTLLVLFERVLQSLSSVYFLEMSACRLLSAKPAMAQVYFTSLRVLYLVALFQRQFKRQDSIARGTAACKSYDD